MIRSRDFISAFLRLAGGYALAVCGLGLFCAGPGHAQVVQAILHKASNSSELMSYYRERLVEIRITATKKSSGEEVTVFGTGFLVSADGIVVTARHVIEPALSPDYKITRPDAVQILLHSGYSTVKLKWVADPVSNQLSKRADIGLFKVNSEGGQPFKYMCMDLSDPNARPDEKVTMASFRRLGNPYYQTDLTFTPGISITHLAGPGDMFRYWGLAQPIAPSMSGGAVVREQTDHVVAVMSNVLAQDGQELAGENYANLLQSATDIGLEAIAPCPPYVPDGLDFQSPQSQQEFMSGSCEGTLAWVPDGLNAQHWVFANSGNYSMRRKDLPACKRGGAGWRSVHLVLNNSTRGACPAGDLSSPASTGGQSFFGVQLVPVVRDGDEDTVDQETWLYRNANLFARRPNGTFFTPVVRKPREPEIVTSFPPSAFNQATRDAAAILSRSMKGCQSISAQECADILALKTFDQAAGLRRPWHGFLQSASRAESTLRLAGEPPWLVRDDWLNKAKNLQVKNWILRYKSTAALTSANPVDLSFCIQPEWKELYLRAFSPAGGVKPELIHVFIFD